LRLGIGWLFFAGAWEKHQNKKFTSEPFLKQAKGPLAPFYLAEVPDVHDFRRWIEQPRKQTPPPEPTSDDPESAKKAAADAAQLKAEVYKNWEEAIVLDWGRLQQSVSSHFGFDNEQKTKAGKLLRYYEGKLHSYLEARANDLAAFRHDLYRDQPEQAQKRFLPEPVADADKDQRRAKAMEVRQWVVDAGNQYRKELAQLATEAQQKTYGELAVQRTTLEKFDQFLIYSHMAIGFCLLVGLLTRLASLGAAFFLLSVVATQPFWIDGSLSWISGPQAVMYQVILLLACLVLMASGAGRWAGLDYFFSIWRQTGAQKEST